MKAAGRTTSVPRAGAFAGRVVTVIAIGLVQAGWRDARAQPATTSPRVIPFQAYLTDTSGRPVENGTYKLVFAIYSDPVQTTNDTKLWEETHDGVPVANGMVNVLLGTIAPFQYMSGHPLAGADLLFEEPRYVGVTVGSSTELVPRQQIIPAIYAADADRAKEADHSAESTHAADADRAKQLVNPATLDPVVTVDASGKVGIGTTNPDAKLDVNGQLRLHSAQGQTSRIFSEWGDLVLQNDAYAHFVVHIQPKYYGAGSLTSKLSLWYLSAGPSPSYAERVRLSTNGDSYILGGNVGIGTTAPAFLLHVAGDAGKPGGGSWSATSDVRLKKNVRTLTGSLDRLLQLRGVSFEFIDPAAINELPGPRIGMVAQEVEPIIPDWVSEGSDGYKRLTVRGFEALTVEALRDLRNEKDREIEALRDHKAAQDAQIVALRAEKDTKIETLRAENEAQIEALRKHNQELEARLAGIEALLLKQANPQDPAVRTVAFHEAEAVQERADVSGLQNQSTGTQRLIPFQAYLTDTAGRPVEGAHTLTFGIYDDPTQGSSLWSETHANVPVAKGLVNVLLGSIEPFRDISTVPPGVLLFDDKRYVGVQVDGGPELVPRQQIIPAIHAADSDRARQLVKPGTLDPAVTVDASGKVGVGTTSPQGALQISSPLYEALVLDRNYANNGPSLQGLKQGVKQGQIDFTENGVGIYDHDATGFLVLKDGGNVGIGTTNPESKLHVEDGGVTIRERFYAPANAWTTIEAQPTSVAGLYTVAVQGTATNSRRVYLVLFSGNWTGPNHVVLGEVFIGASPITAEFAHVHTAPDWLLKLNIRPSETANVYVSKIRAL